MQTERKNYRQRWGERVARGREPFGYSQAGLAEAVGVTQQTISSIERGETAPGEYLKVRIANALGMKPAQLFSLDDVIEDTAA